MRFYDYPPRRKHRNEFPPTTLEKSVHRWSFAAFKCQERKSEFRNYTFGAGGSVVGARKPRIKARSAPGWLDSARRGGRQGLEAGEVRILALSLSLTEWRSRGVGVLEQGIGRAGGGTER
ncbi:hypothetical protein MA16_Dca005083 [Dendrobium catenatum]|uniref:Uncharacterized protein n=1 Tax=Dendrobium catenatum TaxID=906689 RepID=A0A2I0WGX2_9ASPA|nr:hypothetical protein MA16_Dca005083 [Dendrobium catenatum]